MGVNQPCRSAAILALGPVSRAADRDRASRSSSNNPGRHPGNQHVRRHVACNNTSGGHHRALADRHATQDRRVGADTGPRSHVRWHQPPSSLGEQLSILPYGRWIEVIGETDMRAYEGAFLDRHAGRDEGEWLNLDIATQMHVALDLDERSYLAAVSNHAAIKVDELRVPNDNLPTNLDVRRNQRLDLTQIPRPAIPERDGRWS